MLSLTYPSTVTFFSLPFGWSSASTAVMPMARTAAPKHARSFFMLAPPAPRAASEVPGVGGAERGHFERNGAGRGPPGGPFLPSCRHTVPPGPRTEKGTSGARGRRAFLLSCPAGDL